MANESSEVGRRDRREHLRHMLHQESRRLLLLRAAIVGLAAGLLAVIFQIAVGEAESFGKIAADASRQSYLLAPLLIVCTACLGAVSAYLVGRYVPEAGGSGIPHVKAALAHLRIVRPIPILIAKFFGGLAALLAGMSLGREGPTVQMGAAVGKLMGDVLRVPKRSRGALLSAGAGAGLAAAFNAPLAGFLFVMEELKREMSAITYGTALISSVFAVAMTRYIIGEKPSFVLPSPGGAPLKALPLMALLGALVGLAGVLYNKGLVFALEIRSRYKIPRYVYGFCVGAASGVALLYLPEIAGGGHPLAESLLSGHYHPENFALMLGILFVTKLILTWFSYGTGLPGGIFAPILVLGALLGYLFGLGVHHFLPVYNFSVEGFALIGMSALLAASVRAPLTGVVLIVEMTAEYNLLYGLLVSSFVASLVAEALRDEPIYEALMERDLRLSGAEVHPEVEPIILEVLIEPDSAMDGKRVKDLRLPAGAMLATIDRDSRHLIPGGSTLLKSGDMVTVMIEGDKAELSLVVHEAARAP